jgi:prolipoprotein diacylglyceryltransferase
MANKRFDKSASGGFGFAAKAEVFILGKKRSAFQVCGYTGVLAAIALSMTLASKTGLSLWVMSVVASSAMLAFLGLALATKVITGREQLVYYQQEIGVMLVSALTITILHKPVLPYLDIAILGIGAFLACGRIGCLMVGCCHGRPFSWGIFYREEHAKEGFAPYLVGVRLFPIQALESLWVLFVVIVGVRLVLVGRPPGTALAWYTIAYGAARFSFEFIRGDSDRPYTFGFSQGQWLSLWLMSAMVWAEFAGRVPFCLWHTVALTGLPLTMLGVTLHRRLDASQKFRILHPHHVSQVAAAINAAEQPGPENENRDGHRFVRLSNTSSGVRISSGTTKQNGATVHHYTLSMCTREMKRATAASLAQLVMQLRRGIGSSRLLPSSNGVFHLLVREENTRPLKQNLL